MLITIETLINRPIMSIQTGTQLAETVGAIVDPRQLTIVAFYVDGPLVDEQPSVLHPADIREISDIGLIVDSESKLMSLEGLVRLNEVIGFGFELIGLKAVDEDKRKLGRVTGYSIDGTTFTVQQIYTEKSLLRSLGAMGNTIHRSQVVSVNNERLIAKSTRVKNEVKQVAREAKAAFVNPFRGTSQPEG